MFRILRLAWTVLKNRSELLEVAKEMDDCDACATGEREPCDAHKQQVDEILD